VTRTFLLVAPAAIPAGLVLAALAWAWRIYARRCPRPATPDHRRWLQSGRGQMLAVVRHLPARIRHGRPLRLLLRGLAAALLALAVLRLIPGQPAAPALVSGLIIWFARTGRSDLAPPPEHWAPS
jgi:hypothetical protein